MNKKELKKEFEFCCSALVKTNDTWDFYWDVLDVNEKTRDFFKIKFEKLLSLLNEDDTSFISMETDDIYDILELNKIEHMYQKTYEMI